MKQAANQTTRGIMGFYCSSDLSLEQAFLNRGMLFAESPFTTLLSFNGRYLFLEDHFTRLKKSYEFLYQRDDWQNQEEEVQKGLAKLKQSEGYHSFRITFFQLQEDQSIHFFIYQKDAVEPKNEKVRIAVAKSKRGESLLPSHFKYGNYCETNVEKSFASSRGFDDVLFIDHKNMIKECSTSNIFFRKKDIIYTPRLGQGLLDGITRMHLIKCLKANQIAIEEGDYLLDDLYSADEAWISNSIKGFRSIHCIEENKFEDSKTGVELIKLFKSYCGLE